MVRKIKKKVTEKAKKKRKHVGFGPLDESESSDLNDFEQHAHRLSVPLKERAHKLYGRLKEVYTGQHSLDYWYGGFAVEKSPESEIEFWERVADEYEKRVEKYPVRSRDAIFRNVMADALRGTPLAPAGMGSADKA